MLNIIIEPIYINYQQIELSCIQADNRSWSGQIGAPALESNSFKNHRVGSSTVPQRNPNDPQIISTKIECNEKIWATEN